MEKMPLLGAPGYYCALGYWMAAVLFGYENKRKHTAGHHRTAADCISCLHHNLFSCDGHKPCNLFFALLCVCHIAAVFDAVSDM